MLAPPLSRHHSGDIILALTSALSPFHSRTLTPRLLLLSPVAALPTRTLSQYVTRTSARIISSSTRPPCRPLSSPHMARTSHSITSSSTVIACQRLNPRVQGGISILLVWRLTCTTKAGHAELPSVEVFRQTAIRSAELYLAFLSRSSSLRPLFLLTSPSRPSNHPAPTPSLPSRFPPLPRLSLKRIKTISELSLSRANLLGVLSRIYGWRTWRRRLPQLNLFPISLDIPTTSRTHRASVPLLKTCLAKWSID